jgi:hypothetical protein
MMDDNVFLRVVLEPRGRRCFFLFFFVFVFGIWIYYVTLEQSAVHYCEYINKYINIRKLYGGRRWVREAPCHLARRRERSVTGSGEKEGRSGGHTCERKGDTSVNS